MLPRVPLALLSREPWSPKPLWSLAQAELPAFKAGTLRNGAWPRMTRCSAPQDHPRGGGETGARLRRCDSAVSKGPGTASGTRVVLMAQGWSPGVHALVTRPLTLQTGDSRDQWRAKTLPHPLTLRMTSSPLHRARTEVFFFPPSLKNSGLLTKELNRQQVFLIKKGFAAGKEVILTSLVSCAGCRGTFWHIWAFQNCCLRGPRHPPRVHGRA